MANNGTVKSPAERFWPKVDKRPGGCWLWTGAVLRNGYGYFGLSCVRSAPKSILAHRWAYIDANGEPPEGLVIDHLCRVRTCVNPAHMEPVTQQVNLLRGVGPALRRAHFAAITHCVHGHEYTPENTYRNKRDGRRSCKECSRIRQRKAAA